MLRIPNMRASVSANGIKIQNYYTWPDKRKTYNKKNDERIAKRFSRCVDNCLENTTTRTSKCSIRTIACQNGEKITKIF